MTDTIGQEIERRYEAALSRVGAAQTELREAMKDLERLEAARSVIHELSGNSDPGPSRTTLTVGQAAIYEALLIGEDQGLTPTQVYERCKGEGTNLYADYVRTTLWRMAQNGIVRSGGGRYWK